MANPPSRRHWSEWAILVLAGVVAIAALAWPPSKFFGEDHPQPTAHPSGLGEAAPASGAH